MKILFWIFAVLSIPVGLFMSIVGFFGGGLGLYSTVIGQMIYILSTLSLLVSIVCDVLGIIKLRKGNVKKAVLLALAGVAYSAIILASMFIADAVDSMRMEREFAERNEQMYGEGWDAAPAIEGIPELYQEVLNKYYAVVRDRWPAEDLMDLGAVGMADYYGEASLDNIGFALVDLNGDRVDELVIGTVAQADQQGNEIFCIYTDPENPFYAINSVEGNVYYLHSGEADGTYEAEIVGLDSAWVIETAESENTFDLDIKEGAMDPARRLTLAMTPFSQYK